MYPDGHVPTNFTHNVFLVASPAMAIGSTSLGERSGPMLTRFMEPTWSPPGFCRPKMDPMSAPWTLLSGALSRIAYPTRSIPWPYISARLSTYAALLSYQWFYLYLYIFLGVNLPFISVSNSRRVPKWPLKSHGMTFAYRAYVYQCVDVDLGICWTICFDSRGPFY